VVSTIDIAHWWDAYDQATATSNPAERADIIERLYVGHATPGLRALMEAREYTTADYVEAITRYPKFWASVRPLTLRAANCAASLQTDLKVLRRLYPALKPAGVTYAIGAMRTGGTTTGRMVLIGAEIALADETVDVSELPDTLRARLGTFFKTRPIDHNAQNNVHEYVHTQQKEAADMLLARVVYEGVADFTAHLVTGHTPPIEAYVYGPAHADEIRGRFKADMASASTRDWLYNSASNAFGVSDLGYYVGYQIADSYYAQTSDKRAAIRNMIELDYADAAAVRAFIERSGYF
jgi:hypothetical protein